MRVLGIDANGKAFPSGGDDRDISMSGARVTGLTAQLNPGDIVGLQSGGEKCRFKVSWVTANGDGTFQVGLHCVEKGMSPWRDKIQQTALRAIAAAMTAIPATVPSHCARQHLPRQSGAPCATSARADAMCNASTWPPRETSQRAVHCERSADQRRGRGPTSRPTVGMGLLWCDLGWDGQEKLNTILRSLALNYTETNSSKLKALAQLEKLQQL